MRTGKPCSSQSLSVRENIGWHRSPFYCVAVVLRSTFQRSRGIIEKGWHLFSWNAGGSSSRRPPSLILRSHGAEQAPPLGCGGLRSPTRPFRRIDRSTLELRENIAILWRSLYFVNLSFTTLTLL